MTRRSLSAPLAVQLFIARSCNLACCHCSNASARQMDGGDDLTIGDWTTVLRRLRHIGVFEINLSGGEVFLRPGALELVELAATLGFSRITIQSNGTLITDACAHRLARAGVSGVAVSLDGPRETHDRFRGMVGAFDATIGALRALVREGVRVGVQMTATSANVGELEGLVGAVAEAGVRRINIRRLVAQGLGRLKYDALKLSPSEQRLLREQVEALRHRHPSMKIVNNVPVFDWTAPSTPGRNGTSPLRLKACSAAHSSCSITADGWLVPCAMLTELKAGNVQRADILTIWRTSETLEEVRNLSQIGVDEVPECGGCSFYALCDAGCRGHAYGVFGRLVSPDPDCPFAQTTVAAPLLACHTDITGPGPSPLDERPSARSS